MDYIIYKITCNDKNITDCYVGQTKSFSRRKYSHLRSCITASYRCHTYKLYEFIRNNGGWSNWTMSVIEIYNCIDKYQALQWERHHYEELNATLNSNYPARTPKECHKKYYSIEKNKERNRQYYKLYYLAHKSKLQANQKLYYATHTQEQRIRQKKNYEKSKLACVTNLNI